MLKFRPPVFVLAAALPLVVLGDETPKPGAPEAVQAKPDAAGSLPAPAEKPPEAPAKPAVADKAKEELAKVTAEKDRLTAEVALAQAKLDSELSKSKLNTLRLQSQLAEIKAKQELADYQKKMEQDKQLAELRKQLERVTLENSIAKARSEIEMAEIRGIENAVKRNTTELAMQIELQQKKTDARNYAGVEPVYLEQPLKDGKLIISDRRLSLNGPITMATADHITDRINYYNNRDRKMPIFIVIDNSPGGSVMAGYKILKAMHGSEAPVHVVVKSFAASMAACITTLADKSYAYPNAIILHHQLSSFNGGNLTQQQESVRDMEEWWKRLADPVATKMGVTREEFIKRMYARVSTGDWNEFADEAQKLKWVDNIVTEIEETALLRHPDSLTNPAPVILPIRPIIPGHGEHAEMVERTDERGRPCMTLPRLTPMDHYWLYNPDGYYRLP